MAKFPEAPRPDTSNMTTIKRAERLLTAVGYTPGTVDGQQTPELQAAVMQFQDAWGLPATGTLDEKTLDRLEFSAMRKRLELGAWRRPCWRP